MCYGRILLLSTGRIHNVNGIALGMPHDLRYLASKLVDIAASTARKWMRLCGMWFKFLGICDMRLIEMIDTDSDLVTLLLRSKSKIWEDKKRLGLLGENHVSCFPDLADNVPKQIHILQLCNWVFVYKINEAVNVHNTSYITVLIFIYLFTHIFHRSYRQTPFQVLELSEYKL